MLMLLCVHVTRVLFLVLAGNFTLTMGFYWNYTLLLSSRLFLCTLVQTHTCMQDSLIHNIGICGRPGWNLNIIPLCILTAVTVFEALQCRTSIRVGLICATQTYQVSMHLHCSYEPCPNRSSTLNCFERGNTVEIRIGIMFDLYLGLPHMVW